MKYWEGPERGKNTHTQQNTLRISCQKSTINLEMVSTYSTTYFKILLKDSKFIKNVVMYIVYCSVCTQIL